MPSSNPTTGIGVIAYVQATATPVALTEANQTAPSTGHPNAQYAVTLSLANAATTTVSAVLKDVANTTETTNNGNAASFVSYNAAPASNAANFSSLSPAVSYNAKVATVNASSGLITANAIGQAIVEVSFPTFDSTNNIVTGKVYCQIIVTVTA